MGFVGYALTLLLLRLCFACGTRLCILRDASSGLTCAWLRSPAEAVVNNQSGHPCPVRPGSQGDRECGVTSTAAHLHQERRCIYHWQCPSLAYPYKRATSVCEALGRRRHMYGRPSAANTKSGSWQPNCIPRSTRSRVHLEGTASSCASWHHQALASSCATGTPSSLATPRHTVHACRV